MFRRNKRKKIVSRYADYKHLKKQIVAYIDLCEHCDKLSGNPEFYVGLRKFLDSSLIKVNLSVKKEKLDRKFLSRLGRANSTKDLEELLKHTDSDSL